MAAVCQSCRWIMSGRQLLFIDKFEGGSAKIEIALEIIFTAIKAAAIKKVARMVRIDKIDFQIFDPAHPDGIVETILPRKRTSDSDSRWSDRGSHCCPCNHI